MQSNRVILFDIMKALCVIEIVAFWHMFDYTVIDADDIMFGGSLTSTVLAAFTFASGFFLGKKTMSVRKFYASRLKRFMIPLLVSLLIMYQFGVIDSLRTVVFSAIGLSCFIPPLAPTLWYFSMIIFCYIITPILLYHIGGMNITEKIVNILIRGLIIYMIMILLGVNERVQGYFPFYILGIVSNMDCIKIIVNMNILYKILCGIIWLLGSYFDVLPLLNDLIGLILLVCVSNTIEKHVGQKMKALFEKTAYASMFAYLFHREFYQITKRLVHLPDNTIPVLGIIVTIIFIFWISYYMQKIYDLISQKKLE